MFVGDWLIDLFDVWLDCGGLLVIIGCFGVGKIMLLCSLVELWFYVLGILYWLGGENEMMFLL